ncbi:YrhB family protein [Escherichia coli]|nr:YrhB family protein [Escherichia coli]
MINYQEAFAKANHYLDDADLPVVITLHGRFSQGWYFCFESQEFLETGYEAARLAGNAPFIIDKDSGEIHSLGTAKPLEEYLQDYEIKKLPSACPDKTALFARRGPLTLVPRR